MKEELDNKSKIAVKKEIKNSLPTLEEDTIEKVGDLIKKAREKKKIELEKVASNLRIRKVYLEAIENNDYQALPEYPYGVGFVRSYADYLGLNASRIGDLYASELNIKSKPEKSLIMEDADAEGAVPNNKYLIISIVFLAIIYFSWLLIDKYFITSDIEELSVSGSEETIPDFPLQIEDFTTQDGTFSETGSVVTIIDTTNVDAPSADGQIIVEEGAYFIDDAQTTLNAVDDVAIVSDQPRKVISKGVEVVMLDDTWFEAKNEDRLFVSKEFEPGTSYIVPNRSGMIISVGRPNAVEVYIDGKLVEGVFTPRRKTNIYLDSFLNREEH